VVVGSFVSYLHFLIVNSSLVLPESPMTARTQVSKRKAEQKTKIRTNDDVGVTMLDVRNLERHLSLG
jgi:energy-converting hydrogenase Eha subunit B